MNTAALGGGLHTAWAVELMSGLRAAGAGWAFVCPGSRSTPLALAAAEVFGASLSVVVDERSAAFAALGFARLSGAPAVMIVTSGSAGAHALPAIIEAERACVPLIVITADRPIELFEAGASQTIDQHQLFGRHVRAAFEIGAPDEAALASLARIAFRVVREAMGPTPGAVHVNARFRKPLEPVARAPSAAPPRATPKLFVGERSASASALAHVRALVEAAERPLVIVGPLPFSAEPRADAQTALTSVLGALTAASGLAVAVEITSGVPVDLRAGALPLALLLEAAAFESSKPDLIIELGSPPVTSAYSALADGAQRLVVAPGKSPDPFGTATAFIEADPLAFVRALSLPSLPRARSYRAHLEIASARARAVVERAGSTDGPLAEPTAMRVLAAALPARAVLAIGNSLAVRDLDTYANFSRPHVLLHQRGAAGIDGLVAGAYGARRATDASSPLVLVIGDVSAQHDVGSFALLRGVDAPLVVVVIENGGGRIFDALPVKAAIQDDVFEKLFTTPPGLFLKGAVEAFGIAYVAVDSARGLAGALEVACRTRKASVIEVRTPHDVSVRTRADIRRALREVGDG